MCLAESPLEDTSSSSIQNTCPFTIQQLSRTTYLIRENDAYGEHPHIYAKIYTQRDTNGKSESVIVLSDTGVGTMAQESSTTWTIRSFLESTINPGSRIPYMIILSHCHYDHILGLQHLLPNVQSDTTPEITIVSSTHLPSFITPYKNLSKHSLCDYYGIKAPKYTVDVWAKDEQNLHFTNTKGSHMDLGITVLHTPGHMPDSLSWYDRGDRTLFVGDSFYQQNSTYSQNNPWGNEPSAPIIFPLEGNLSQWWNSLRKLLLFVERENKQIPLVKLAAGHVTAQVDAHSCLSSVKTFMSRVLRDEVPCERLPDRKHQQMGYWRDDPDPGSGRVPEFSLIAPMRLITEGRTTIEKSEWLGARYSINISVVDCQNCPTCEMEDSLIQ